MAWIPLGLALLATGVALYLRSTRWAETSLWVSRLAYTVLVLQAPLYFIARGGFDVSPPNCEWTFGLDLAIYSLTNYKHIVLFGLLFLLTLAQFRGVPRPVVWSVVATIAIGLIVEIAQGASGQHHCRMRDLVPDAVGALACAVLVWVGSRLTQSRPRVDP